MTILCGINYIDEIQNIIKFYFKIITFPILNNFAISKRYRYFYK